MARSPEQDRPRPPDRAAISPVSTDRSESTRNPPTINAMQKLATELEARLSELIREAKALAG